MTPETLRQYAEVVPFELPATKATLIAAADEIEKLRRLVQCLIDNDLDDMAADGVTVLDVWRADARRALGLPMPSPGARAVLDPISAALDAALGPQADSGGDE